MLRKGKLLKCACHHGGTSQQKATMMLFLNDNFQDLDMREVSHLIQSQTCCKTVTNMLLNTLIHRTIHNVAEPIFVTVLVDS